MRHRNIILQPLLERVDIERYLSGAELVVLGGESDKDARPLDFAWVLDVREQCLAAGVPFRFRQCATHFEKDGKLYSLPTKLLCAQARKAAIDTTGAETGLVRRNLPEPKEPEREPKVRKERE